MKNGPVTPGFSFGQEKSMQSFSRWILFMHPESEDIKRLHLA
jgi:hypothetical protein